MNGELAPNHVGTVIVLCKLLVQVLIHGQITGITAAIHDLLPERKHIRRFKAFHAVTICTAVVALANVTFGREKTGTCGTVVVGKLGPSLRGGKVDRGAIKILT